MTNTFNIKPAHSFLRYLGGRSARFHASTADVTLKLPSGKSSTVDSFKIGAVIHSKGIFFSSLSIPIHTGGLRLLYLRKSEAEELRDWLLAHLYEIYSPYVVEDAALIEGALSKGYLRKDTFNFLREKAQKRSIEFGDLPQDGMLNSPTFKCYEVLMDFAFWNSAQLKAHQRSYIDCCQESYKNYFDTVESNPLTRSQREACIIDEQNNLVLAGAGTGKTATMIGRAGFLIQSGQAHPSDILMLAFAKNAAEEMEDRIREKLGDTSVSVSTFHKLGKEIITSVEQVQPSISALAEDHASFSKQVNEWFEKHMQEKKYRDLLLSYFSEFLYPRENPFEFETEGEYFDFIISNGIRTLKGEAVKGVGECLIANHLFKMGINYDYEPAYEHETRSLDFRQYQPDFYLPDHGIYIEHFGIARDGSTAPYVNREEYHRGMDWKRELHAEHNTALVETYFYEHIEGILSQELSKKLQELDVQFNPLPSATLLESLKEFGAISGFADLLAKLLRSYKSQHFGSTEIEEAIHLSNEPDQLRAALKLMLPILADYEEYLRDHQEIDFDDMIGKALQYTTQKKYRPKWKFLLVDEFQDISAARARLLLALRDASQNCSVFCVGDDWQAIYRFSGSDISYTTQYKERFGTTATTALDRTFRFNNSIAEVAERFILENQAQVRKHITAEHEVSRPAISLLRADNRINSKFGNVDNRLVQILERISRTTRNTSSVYLLCRFRFNLPEEREIIGLNDAFTNLSIEAFTIHGSKGKEADFVVLIGLENGMHGFPSQKVTHPLLEALLPPAELYAFAEERRLFYVAITRARKRVYLVTDMSVASEFVVELIDKEYPIELHEFEVSTAQRLFQKIKCKKCETGTLVPRTGQRGTFYGCSHYPLCKYAENGCKECKSAMERIDRFKVCLNPECRSWVPLCPMCGGEMVRRTGKYGKFWGCRNFRGDEPVSCRHSEPEIDATVLEESAAGID